MPCGTRLDAETIAASWKQDVIYTKGNWGPSTPASGRRKMGKQTPHAPTEISASGPYDQVGAIPRYHFAQMRWSSVTASGGTAPKRSLGQITQNVHQFDCLLDHFSRGPVPVLVLLRSTREGDTGLVTSRHRWLLATEIRAGGRRPSRGHRYPPTPRPRGQEISLSSF